MTNESDTELENDGEFQEFDYVDSLIEYDNVTENSEICGGEIAEDFVYVNGIAGNSKKTPELVSFTDDKFMIS